MTHDWKAGDLAQCIKTVPDHRRRAVKGVTRGAVVVVDKVRIGPLRDLNTDTPLSKRVYVWLYVGGRTIGIDATRFIPIKRADDKFCEQMKCIKQKEKVS